jgi:hypothetical protein
MLNASNKTRIVSLSRLGVHVRAGSSFILRRSLMQKRKVCPTRSYQGMFEELAVTISAAPRSTCRSASPGLRPDL